MSYLMWIKYVKTDMNLPNSHCTELVEKTAATLDKKTLQALFVSTQRNKIELSFQWAVQYESRFFNYAIELNKNIDLL
jgi:thiaminase